MGGCWYQGNVGTSQRGCSTREVRPFGYNREYGLSNCRIILFSLPYFFSDLDRLFEPTYLPTPQDIVHCRARTIGITEATFQLKDHEMLMVDVGGQKSERRKWIHCFQDVTSILFLVSLSGYDQCLVEDKDANQMQDAMTIWDSICHSQWFKQTSIVSWVDGLLAGSENCFGRLMSAWAVIRPVTSHQ
jgi:guanine nucleotide-binding protein subunit alpha